MTDNRPPGRGRGFEKVPGAKSVRKNLFGRDQDVEDSSLAREKDELYQRERERFKEKWNFDPETDTKLPGRFKWGEPIPIEQRSSSVLHVPQDGKNPASGDTIGSNLAASSAGCSSSDNSSDTSSPQTSQYRDRIGSAPKRQRSPSPNDENRPAPKSPRR